MAPAGEGRRLLSVPATTKVVETARGGARRQRTPGRESDERPRSQWRSTIALGAARAAQAGIVFRFLTGQDAPVSVLSTTLYQLLPPDRERASALLPGQGRKLLIFADSRQDAAFFAPYLERTYQQVLRRRLILKALAEDPDGSAGRLRQKDLATRVLVQAEAATMFGPEQSFDERKNCVA